MICLKKVTSDYINVPRETLFSSGRPHTVKSQPLIIHSNLSHLSPQLCLRQDTEAVCYHQRGDIPLFE